MTNYENDPNYSLRTRPGYREEEASYSGWIIGGIVALVVIFGIFMLFGRDSGTTNTASNANRPTTTTRAPATTPPATTGSGSATAPAPGSSGSGTR